MCCPSMLVGVGTACEEFYAGATSIQAFHETGENLQAVHMHAGIVLKPIDLALLTRKCLEPEAWPVPVDQFVVWCGSWPRKFKKFPEKMMGKEDDPFLLQWSLFRERIHSFSGL